MTAPRDAEGWARYIGFTRMPLARAIDIVDSIKHGGALPDLPAQSDDVIAMLYRMLTILDLQTRDDAPSNRTARASLDRVDAERRRRDVRGVDTPQATASSQTLADIRALAADAEQAADQHSHQDALAMIGQARLKLAAVPSGLPRHLAEDAEAIGAELALIEAQTFASADDQARAEAAFAAALESADRADRLAAKPRYRLRILLKYCGWAERRDADAVLNQLLPIAVEALAGPPNGERLELLAYLVSFYFRAGDRVEAGQMLGRLERELNLLGFAEPPQDDWLDVLDQWVNAAEASASEYTERYRTFHRALLGYVTVVANRTNLRLVEPNAGTARLTGLTEFTAELQRREETAMTADLALIERHAPEIAAGLGDRPGPGPQDHATIVLFGTLADQYNTLGATEELLGAFQALAAHPACGSELQGQCQLRIGLIHGDLGRPDQAAAGLRAAHDSAAETDNLDLETEARTYLIFPHFEAGDFAAASDACAQAIDRIEAARQRVTATYLRSAFMAEKTRPYLLGIVAAEKLEDWGLMVSRMELLKARTFQGEQAEAAIGDDRLVAELADVSRQLAGQRDETRRAELLAARRMVWDRLALQRKRRVRGFDLGHLQRRLTATDVVLYYFFLEPVVLVRCAITSDRVSVDKAVIENEAAFIAALDRVATARSTTRGLDLDFADLAPVLLPDHMHAMIDRATNLIVCAHQALHQVPFAALPWRDRRLIDRMTVGMVPNLTCLLAAQAAREHALGLFGLACRDSVDQFGHRLPSLSQVENEVLAAATTHRGLGAAVEVLVGPKVERAILADETTRAQLSAARYVHIGTHGSDVAGEEVADAPMEARLYLADGPVDGIDIATWPMAAELVVLAACHAGKRAVSARGASRLPTDAVWGLQAAFHEAGARAVFAPLWPADDQTTPHLMAGLHDGLARGLSPVAAARHAVLRYLEQVNPNWRDPRFWASFVIIGFGSSAFGLLSLEDD